VQNFVFAVDLEPTMDLLEGRFNSVKCLLCEEKISFLSGVLVMNYDEHAILAALPEGAEESDEAKLYTLAEQHGFSLKICRDYNELRGAAVGWIDRYIVPIGSKLISGEIKRLPLEQQISLVTPFFLRVLKASLDGNLSPVWKTSGGSPEQARQFAEESYRAILIDHLVNLRKLVVAQSQFTALPVMIDEHVPQACLTAPVLEDVVSRCGPIVDPIEDPQGFIRTYLNEYLCASVHSCAGLPNPRGPVFASYLVTCWRLSKSENVVFDDRALLSNEVIHRMICFEDLWDILTHRPPDNPPSPEEMQDVFALLADFGYQKELNQLMKTGTVNILDPDQLTPQTKEQLANGLLESIFEGFPFNHSPEDSEGVGDAVATVVSELLRNRLEEQAFFVVDQVLQKGKEADDPVACISICAKTIEVLCKNLFLWQASALAEKALEFLNDARVSERPSLFIQIWNELGNVARYLHLRKDALNAYQFVEQINEVAPIEEDEREKNRLVVRRNIGIIYREMGDYRSALKILKSVSEVEPNNASLFHNLATFYIDLNLYQDAIRCLDRAVEIAFGQVRATDRSRYLFSRSQVRLALGEAEAGLCDLMEAYQHIPPENLGFRGALAAGAMSFYPQSLEGQRFVAECQVLVKQLIAEGTHLNAVEAPFLYGSLCTRLLRDGQVETAKQIFAPLWEWVAQEDASYSWDIAYLEGWLQYAQHRDERCWPFLLDAGEKIDLAVPTGSNVQFAPFWLQNKSEFQNLLAAVALDLAGRGLIPAEELLGVYELMNGREISARILGAEAARMNGGSAILARCASHSLALERNLKVFFFIETERKGRLAFLDAQGGMVRLLDLPEIDISDLGVLKSNLRQAFKKANPADLSRLDKKLAGWEELSRQLGAALAPHLQPGAHIYFLPGRAFTGLPLHLLAMPDGRPLVEWNPVSLAPNFAVLLEAGARETDDHRDGLAIVTVTKAADSLEFKQNALKAGRDLVTLLDPHTPVNWLQEQQADLAAVKTALGAASEVIFLCHGTTAGPDKGYGICLAAGGLLPPTILSVREVPEHLRFILNWEDIEQSPPTFVSIACSSGITEMAKGGVRFGLEQTLFSSGTTRIISPLWDVNQESSLYWVQAFYRARQSEPVCSIEEAYQQACLETRQLYPHYYFWGPFMINGAL